MTIELTTGTALRWRCFLCGEWSDKYRLQGFVTERKEVVGVLCVHCVPDDLYKEWCATASDAAIREYGRLLREVCEMNGEIKRVFVEKGFGFIKGEDGADYFLHQSAVRGVQFESLEEGLRVTFKVVPSAKGQRAEQVQLVEA
jgi:CspA family cold shock protein